LLGEPLDERNHAVRGAVKAVTYHDLDAREIAPGRYRLQIVVDV
jgi:SHS2 domain-containing protein